MEAHVHALRQVVASRNERQVEGRRLRLFAQSGSRQPMLHHTNTRTHIVHEHGACT
jgi:hypothetical protein